MEILAIFFSGILGTAIMTGFSHVVESVTGHKFNEAHLLNGLISNLKSVNSSIGDNHYLGWIIHFVIGICMAAILYCYYVYIAGDILVWTGLFLGFILGIIGVAGWSMMISFHKDPPKINWTYFFLQLIIAHMIFGITVTWVFVRFVMPF
ncbi:hypothetical protein [Maribacter litoralis]|uniref:DUF2938 domain-containing protein n=1 Tax=Maribacter litoralis TaxID=2059726 RepID=A0A653P3U5_9FLAO|nr:hypothetical protein [Maribacter litoralis]VXB24263.1 conserved membrane hypothetical protein [Maribacter litoralis]